MAITMYTTVWCGFCQRLKAQLGREGIEVVEVDTVPPTVVTGAATGPVGAFTTGTDTAGFWTAPADVDGSVVVDEDGALTTISSAGAAVVVVTGATVVVGAVVVVVVATGAESVNDTASHL